VILCLDVGNSQIYGGLFDGGEIRLNFRKVTGQTVSSDEYGLFLKVVLRENGFDPDTVSHIGICSVVPDIVHSLRNGCVKYFGAEPFVIGPGVKSGLNIKYRNPREVGADRIANAIAAVGIWPNRNLIIVDLGTATTFCAVSKNREYLGGAIIPGMRISMEALSQRTAKLPKVEIVVPENGVGRSTVESIQSGLFYGHVGSAKEIIRQITQECFANGDGEERPLVVGTGGFSRIFEKEGIFDAIAPDLVLQGIYQSLILNLNLDPGMEMSRENGGYV